MNFLLYVGVLLAKIEHFKEFSNQSKKIFSLTKHVVCLSIHRLQTSKDKAEERFSCWNENVGWQCDIRFNARVSVCNHDNGRSNKHALPQVDLATECIVRNDHQRS